MCKAPRSSGESLEGRPQVLEQQLHAPLSPPVWAGQGFEAEPAVEGLGLVAAESSGQPVKGWLEEKMATNEHGRAVAHLSEVAPAVDHLSPRRATIQ